MPIGFGGGGALFGGGLLGGGDLGEAVAAMQHKGCSALWCAGEPPTVVHACLVGRHKRMSCQAHRHSAPPTGRRAALAVAGHLSRPHTPHTRAGDEAHHGCVKRRGAAACEPANAGRCMARCAGPSDHARNPGDARMYMRAVRAAVVAAHLGRTCRPTSPCSTYRRIRRRCSLSWATLRDCIRQWICCRSCCTC